MEIRKVTLKTKDLQVMRSFYTETLGMSLEEENRDSFQISAGSSQLEFTSNNVKDEPCYHFAFNIPSNKFKEAKAWVNTRVEINCEEGEDEAYFSHMNAHSLYFYDPAGNIVEFISRHSTSPASEAPFTIESILNISEVGLTVGDACKAGEQLTAIGVKERDNCPISNSSLNFMGDKKTGSFLLLNQPGRKWIFSNKISAVYPLEVQLDTNNRVVINEDDELLINPTVE
ncbi:VOC family protein [Halobacillus sp. Marseille-P3879]|uniref:VOC family protein n=1 Tax=Halobacillus sp. Marseille-P3879 TaxID=2045014 RepID=UPI000C7DAE5A|nr:VOC family protein [Halobacillus sp. Marseille-P3879]